MWPGNTTDVTSLIPVVDRLRRRFSINQICIVVDRGMTCKETIKLLEGREWKYILGARLRSVQQVKREVLSRGGRYREVYPGRNKSKDPAPLKVKQVMVNDHRYVVCFNPEQARYDAMTREAIVESLQQQLRRGKKSLVGNKGYRRTCILLLPGTDSSQESEDRLQTEGWKLEWNDVVQDLDCLEQIKADQEGKQFLLRTATKGVAGKVFQAVGVALPPTVECLQTK